MGSGLKAKLGKQGKRETVEMEIDGEKISVDVQEPNSVKIAAAVRASGGTVTGKDEKGEETEEPKDFGRFIASLIVQCTFEPGTKVPVFSDAEIEMVMGAGRQIDAVQSAVMKSLAGGGDAPAKKSEPTGSSEPDSSSPSGSAGPSST